MPKDHDLPQPAPPPHNLAAEMAVLGAILFDNNAYQRVSDFLKTRDFYAKANATIYEVLERMISSGRVADGVILREHFEHQAALSEIGGARYLADLLDSAAFGPEIYDYARLVHDLALRRELIQIGSEIVQKATKSEIEEPGEKQIEAAEKQLFSLAERGAGAQGFQTFNTALAQSIRTAALAYQRDGKIAGVATGLDELDRMLGGLHKSDLVILAARPSMGKSALGLCIAANAAVSAGVPTAFFSLEMSVQEIAQRMMCLDSRVDSHKIRTGQLSADDWPRLSAACARLENAPLYVDDTPGLSLLELRSRAQTLKRREPKLGLVVVDYLQLMTAGGSVESRLQEVSAVSRGLKALAKDLDVPVLALSQLSRAVEQRTDKRPVLSDLRESGSIEQDADIVMFIYRDEYYNGEESDQQGLAEVIVAKHRNGPTDTVKLSFLKRYAKFSDLAAA
jgi:replicative DNA helicase